jgi:endonuclease-8
MPEGPTINLLKETLTPFIGKKILSAAGNAKIDMALLKNKKIISLKTWGKQFFISTKDATIRVHFLMFGSYSLNEQTKPDKQVRLCLHFKTEKIYFYTCSVKIVDDPALTYDWPADVLSDIWDSKGAAKKLKALPGGTMVCDALLNQEIFSGVGNIIKNEVLYRIRLHPESLVERLSPTLKNNLISEARNYSFDFLKWKRAFVLKKHWLVYTKKTCLRCNLPIIKKYCGITQRGTFFCENCQIRK